jgi:rRNA processing protein Gar1
VRAVTPAGRLTVRCADREAAPEGTHVTDRRHVVRGVVVRVFGPVSRPYLSVRLARPPTPAEGLALLDTSLIRE